METDLTVYILPCLVQMEWGRRDDVRIDECGCFSPSSSSSSSSSSFFPPSSVFGKCFGRYDDMCRLLSLVLPLLSGRCARME